jgi:hypothetical protein
MDGMPLEAANSGRVNIYGNSENSTDRLSTKLLADTSTPLPDKPAPSDKVVVPDKPSDPGKPDQSLLGKIAENTWLQINGASYHLDRGRHFNERNYGLGLMYRIAPDKAVAVGQYENSIGRKSHYAYFDYEPLKLGPVRAGVLAGVVDGYYFNKGGPIPMASPTASIEGKHFGVSVFYIPPMPQISSVFAVQARVKF